MLLAQSLELWRIFWRFMCVIFNQRPLSNFVSIGSCNENNHFCFKVENFISTIEKFLIDLTFRTVYRDCSVPLYKNEECLTLSAIWENNFKVDFICSFNLLIRGTVAGLSEIVLKKKTNKYILKNLHLRCRTGFSIRSEH